VGSKTDIILTRKQWEKKSTGVKIIFFLTNRLIFILLKSKNDIILIKKIMEKRFNYDPLFIISLFLFWIVFFFPVSSIFI
jgi:hypothetical protein